MPIYEYKCPFCDFKIELKQRMTEEHKALCPECEKDCDRIFSTYTFVVSDKKRKKELTGFRKSVF